MYKEGDLIKVDFDTQIRLGQRSWEDRWLQCPYVVVYTDQHWDDIVQVMGKVHRDDGIILSRTPIQIYSENSKLIERYDDE